MTLPGDTHILAGIDEAGYGPLLGPLVVGSCAAEVSGPASEEGCADLWAVLRRVVCRGRPRNDRLIQVADSKAVYTPSSGVGQLERSVLSLLSSMGRPEVCDSLDALLAAVDPDAPRRLAEQPWYAAPAGERWPMVGSGLSVRICANGLSAEMTRTGCRVCRLRATVMPERPLNRLLTQTRNKSNALFSIAGVHLDQLVREFGGRGLHVVCDRQGGRSHYDQALRLLFPDFDLSVDSEGEGRSDYSLRCAGWPPVRITFMEKSESVSFPTAAASMLCKYLREALMERFNHWWGRHVPGLTPTAGYYSDGKRFLGDIAAKRDELGVSDSDLVRVR